MIDCNTHLTPEVATGQSSLAAPSPFTTKKRFGDRWEVSDRMIDKLLAKGMPHLKIGSRRVRICIAEADQWMNEQFRTVRRNGGAR